MKRSEEHLKMKPRLISSVKSGYRLPNPFYLTVKQDILFVPPFVRSGQEVMIHWCVLLAIVGNEFELRYFNLGTSEEILTWEI